MKRLILLMIATVALNSCVEPTKKIEKEAAFLDQKLQNFITAHPEWKQNEIIEKRVNAILVDSLAGWKKDKRFLDGLPLRLESIDHVDENGKMVYFAAFVKAGEFLVPEGYEGLPISITVLSVVDKAEVEKLKTGVDYLINGDYIKTLDNGLGNFSGNYSLGTYRFKISSFKKY